MKNDLDHFRKFTIIELVTNQKKFKDYLELCKKTDNSIEKQLILESLVNYTNEKSITNNQNTIKQLTDLTLYCTYCIIYSDFEVENFAKINNFSINFQKNILLQAINQCSDRFKDQLETITFKFYFWVLSITNQSIIKGFDIPSQQISESEINESFVYLEEKLKKNEFTNNKINLCKLLYELGLNKFLKNNFNDASPYFEKCLAIFNEIEKKNLVYFDLDYLEFFIIRCKNQTQYEYFNNEQEIKPDSQMENSENFQSFFFEESQKIEKFNYKSLNIDDTKIFEIHSLKELISFNKNMILISMKDKARIKEAKTISFKIRDYANNDKKLKTLNDKKNEVKLVLKEISYHLFLIELIEKIEIDHDQDLNPNYLKNLSQNIFSQSLTEDIEINGLLHALLLNFKNSFKSVFNYFRDFIEYIEKNTEDFEMLKVKEISFIATIVQIKDEYNKHQIVVVEGKQHLNFVNSVFFWIQSQKDKKIVKNENIINIIIKSLKSTEFLEILKILLVGCLKFVFERRPGSIDDLKDSICNIDQKIFKFECILSQMTGISFKEDNKNTYNFESIKLDLYQEELFKYVYKIEKKLNKLNNNHLEYLRRLFNLLFLERNFSACFKIYLDYIETKFKIFKEKYLRLDISNEFTVIEELYFEFKKLLDNDLILKACYCLSFLNLNLEASILLQYLKKIDYDIAYNLLTRNPQHHSLAKLEFVWKISYFELLANIYYKNGITEHLTTVTTLIKRTSNHQSLKKHNIRKHFKIINFFKFSDNLKNQQ